MFPNVRNTVLVALTVCLLAFLPAASMAADCAGATYGADSPEALIEGVQSAARDQDMGQLARYLSKSDRAKAGLGLTIGATMMLAMQEMGLGMAQQGDDGGGDEVAAKKAELSDLQTRLQGILDEYGVQEPDQATMGRLMQSGPDGLAELESTMDGVCTTGLIADLATFLGEVSEQKVTQQLERLTTDDVGPVTVDGDTATSTIGGEEFRMNRIDGRWYVDIESTANTVGPG